MRVERLEVFGFKSFMERLVLPLEQGITGVVGPNGCGKSNIIDALRWVLGESRASQLRGGVLEDVIFNGTESLRPLGLAEVSVVVRADSQSLYDDLISYYESVEGDAYDVGSGDSAPEASSEVSPQAAADSAPGSDADAPTAENTDELPQEEPHSDAAEPEAQQVAEEQQPGSERAVEPPQAGFIADIKASLSKYSWLNSVSEVQITRRLYRSGESEFFINKVPCRLKDIKELFRVVGLAARGYTIIAQGEIGRIITAKPDDRRMVIEEAAHIAGFRENMNAVSKRVVDTEAQVVRLDDVLKEVARQVGNLKRQAARAATRAELKAELSVSEHDLFRDTLGRLTKKIDDSATKSEGLAQEEAAAQSALDDIRGEEQRAREQSVRHDSEIEQLRQRSDQARDELSRRNREVVAKESRIREINSVVQARKSEITRLEDRRSMLTQRKEESWASLNRMEESAGALDQELSSLDLTGEDELKGLSASLQQMREDQRTKDRTIRDLRDKLVSAQSRRDAIQSQMTAASPITHLKRALGGEGQLPTEVTANCKLLVDGIKVADRYTKALQSVLAERATFLVVDEVAQVARTFQELVLKADPQNKKGIGVGLFASIPEQSADWGRSPEYDGIVSLLSQVEALDWSRGLVKRLLSNVWVAPDLDTATAYLEHLAAQGEPDPETVIVTESGDLLSPWSFYSLRHDGGVIMMKSKVDEANRIIDENQGEYDSLVSQRDEMLAAIASGEKRHSELVRAIQQGQAKLREISNRQGEVRGRIQSETRMLNQLDGDLQRIEPQLAEIQGQIAEFEVLCQEISRELEELRQRDNSELERGLNEALAELRGLEEKRRLLRDSSAQLMRGVELKRQAHELIRDRLMRERMATERLRGELASAETNIRERQGAEALRALIEEAQATELLIEDSRRELEARVAAIRQRLEREGEVDPTVIEQFEAESNRLEELTVQREDLVKALDTLRTTLAELQEACTRRFLATFEAIRKNFAFFGPKLFGGGSAELSLSDLNNPLEGGVDIVVRPPGKKPKSIDLLSGGEKALCAIALVFSMFMVRPSPICVLDEVDAPLDEANVHRFVSFIKEMSARTQFLMITHNKASMAAADTLVGVTMPQPGASKVISVSLQEAQKQVA
jgi:chromosome segregation protein